jgi:hypothetical protein
MYLQKGITRKLREKKLFFVGILNVTDEKSRIRSRIRIRTLSQSGTDPRIGIRTKMSRIRNTTFLCS